jgi:glucose-6-phosphate isomerase
MSPEAPGGVTLSLSYPASADLEGTVRELMAAQVASKLTAQDPTLWGPAAASEAAIRLSWVGLAASSRPLLAQIAALREELAADGVDHVVLAGMGGSSLAPEVIAATAGVDLVALDTTDPGQIRSAMADNLERTVLVVSSKSGTTVETDSHRRAYTAAFTAAGINAAKRIVVVTDPDSPLAELAVEEGYRRLFLADPHVGGRYSALTAFGLVPAGLAGADIARLLDEAAAIAPALGADNAANPGLRLGALLGLAHAAESEKVVLADTGSGIHGFGDWAEQLIAESTGKEGKGLLPVVVEGIHAPGFRDAKDDAVQVVLGPEPDAAALAAVTPFGVGIRGPLGALFLVWEYAIAVAGRLIGINPFDQPNVEAAKAQARELLAGGTAQDDAPVLRHGSIEVRALGLDLADVDSVRGAIDALLAAIPERGYVAVQAYLDRLADRSAADLREAVALCAGRQTTFGWGPRFLHSTGQYHKGGHPNGGFLQISADCVSDLDIPDRPYSFAVLQAAQAAGDALVLAQTGQPVLRLHLTDRRSGIGELLQIL